MVNVKSAGARVYPATVWLLVLVVVFFAEYSVMLALPWLLPGQPSRFLVAMVDAIILTTVLAPVLWWTVVGPLRQVIALRTQFLSDLFARIEADRRRVAHELHDGVGQSLSLLVSGLRSVHETATDPHVAVRQERLLNIAQGTLQDVKRMALGLRPSLLDDLGLAPALERLVADVRDQNDVDVMLDASDIANTRLPEAAETAVFRIVQEALANAISHARARNITVVVRQRDGRVNLEVHDDGCGMAINGANGAAPGHLGLIGMRERTKLLGGMFALGSSPGRGTRITATIPVRG